jgi:ClpP class serine protease
MASAAYWIGVTADAIFAEPSAEIGSIGVYSAFLDESRAFEMEGLKTELFKTGKYKGMGMPGLPLTEDQRALIQAEVDRVNKQFARVEQVKKFFLLDRQLTAEDEELTPTMKLKRKLVQTKYAEQIEAMYRG